MAVPSEPYELVSSQCSSTWVKDVQQHGQKKKKDINFSADKFIKVTACGFAVWQHLISTHRGGMHMNTIKHGNNAILQVSASVEQLVLSQLYNTVVLKCIYTAIDKTKCSTFDAMCK